jgi:hypothetical protein
MAPLLLRSLLVVLAACKEPGLLADTPIVGGSDEVRDAIRAELAAFDEATGFGRTRVSRVRVQDLGERLGRFDRIGRGIGLHEELDQVAVVEVLRHELCHALNSREELHEAEPALYERLASGVFGEDVIGDSPGCRSRSCQQDEVFAAYCAKGPWIAQAWTQQCPDDPADAVAALGQMAETLWTSAPEPLPTTERGEWASLQLEAPSPYIRAWGSTSPEIFFLDIETPEGSKGGQTWLRSGEPAWGEEVWVPPLPDAYPPGLPLELPSFRVLQRQELTRGPVGQVDGLYTAMVEVDLFDQGAALRQVYSDGERWWLVGDGCTDVQVGTFIADGRVFTLRTQGTHLGWGPVEP